MKCGNTAMPSSNILEMIRRQSFWELESDAPIFERNGGFMKPSADANTELLERMSKWPAMVLGEDYELTADLTETPVDQAQRIFKADAERTFRGESNRADSTRLLQTLFEKFGDYHQGLSYCASLLSLGLERKVALNMLIKLNDSDFYLPGYWKERPNNFVRDAAVYGRLAEEYFPEVYDRIVKGGIVPEAYAQKWFVGMCVHVLPFNALFDYWEKIFQQGYVFEFKFTMSLLEKLSEDILATKTNNVAKLFEMLRLDKKLYPDNHQDGTFFTDIIANADKYEDLTAEKIGKLREEEMEKLEKKLAAIREREARMAEESSDSEIVFSDESDDE